MSAAASSQPDYSDQIKREIEKEVCALIERLKEQVKRGYHLDEPLHPDYVELGITLTVHRGKTLYSTGDTILGIPVVVVHYPPRTISVYQRDAWITNDEDITDEDKQDLGVSITV